MLLPLEIRHIIYEYLGFPFSQKIWIHRWEGSLCSQFSHIFKEEDIPKEWAYEAFHLETIWFVDPRDNVAVARGTLLAPDGKDKRGVSIRRRDCEKKCEYCLKQGRWLPFEPSMMRVNQQIHAELCELLYKKVTVAFDYELSERKVHFVDDVWHKEGKRYWAFDRHEGYNPSTSSLRKKTRLIQIQT